MRRDDELRDLHAARDREGRCAMIDEDRGHFAAVIRVDRAWRVQHCDAVLEREPRSRPNLSFDARGQRQRNARGHGLLSPRQQDKHVLDCGNEVKAGGARRGIAGQRQIARVRQPLNLDLHAARFPTESAISDTNRCATSSFDISGHASAPFAVMTWTRFLSLPMIPAPTSLAMIQSQPLAMRLAEALAMRSSVSAAKPMTSDGRFA